MKWKRQPPEHENGDYWFDGRFLATAGVTRKIPEEELIAIAQELNRLAIENGGLDYLQVYVHEEMKVKVWVIDQVTRMALRNGDHPPEHNYFTILFPSEY